MKFAAAALVAAVSANTYDFMGEDDLLAQLGTQSAFDAFSERIRSIACYGSFAHC